MSSIVIQTRANACSYNKKASRSVGWGGQIPQLAIEAYPNLAKEVDSTDFALAVEAFQEDAFGAGSGVDGKMGRGTWSAMLKRFDRIEDGQAYWTINDRRVGVDIDPDVEIVNFDQP